MGDESHSVKPLSSEQAVFAEALRREMPAARAAYLDGACGIDTPMRRRVEALLRASENAGEFLEKPPTGLRSDPDGSVAVGDLIEKPGDRIGRYKLLEKIGEGGCGIVYMAEQEEPVRRRVALKVIKLGMDTRSVVARFEAERQALALMDHPNIAKVFDGGATPAGRPYFVMELVRGMRITEFCDEAKLPLKARLSLFVQTCQAVQHAHQKGIIHRDLKPSNILVTVNDGVPVPKIIDFGIAKATGEPLTAKTVFTQFHSFIGTPAYTSPEQAEMSSLDIDTRSDIYSLGVLLYELLTGKTPFDGEELLRSGLDQMRRTIREVEPPRPSHRLTALMGAERKVPSQRLQNAPLSGAQSRVTPELIRTVRGDLDWIVMKCLEKNRGRRYETANGLATDIQRYLNHEPVTARSPSGVYLVQKLAQRNRGLLVMTATVFVTLVLAVLSFAISNSRIRRERNQKENALRDAQEQLFASLLNQAKARRNSLRIGQRLESLAALSAAARIQSHPEIRDNAIAAMALVDVYQGPAWIGPNPDPRLSWFDENYRLYALAHPNGQISIHNVSDHAEIQRLESDAASPKRFDTPPQYLEFSQDGRYLAGLREDFQLRIWQLDTGKPISLPIEQKVSVSAFSPNGLQVAVATEDSIQCFDLPGGRERFRWRTPGQVYMLLYNPDSRRLAAGFMRQDVVALYDTEDGAHLTDLPVGASAMEHIAWHPNGQFLATAGSNPRIQIWNVETQHKVAELEGHVEQVTGLAFHPDGELLASSSWDGVLRLWHPSPGRLLMHVPWPNVPYFSQDGRCAGVLRSGDNHGHFWGIVPSREYHTFLNTENRSNAFFEGDLSPDGRLLVMGATYGVGVWDVVRGTEIAMLPLKVTDVAMFGAEGHELLTCGKTEGLQRWKISGNPDLLNRVQIESPHRFPLPFAPTRIAKCRDGLTLAVAGEEAGQAALLDLATETVRLAEMPHQRAGFVAVTQDGTRLATSGWHSEHVKLWDANTGKLLRDFVPGLTSRVHFTPDNQELIVARALDFTFYNLKTLQVSRQMPRQLGLYPGQIAFTSDGKLMALEMAPGLIHLVEVVSGRTVAKLEDPNGDLSTWMGFTPDGTQLIVAARYAGAIHRWDLRAIRERLRGMKVDWEYPEFLAAAPPRASDHRPLRIQVLAATKSEPTSPSPGRP